MIDSWFVVANPTSGNKNFAKNWKFIKNQFNEKGIEYSSAFTEFSKHEIDLVQEAIKKGYRKFIAVGGDGTIHHVVNGIMSQKQVKTTDITVGVIPLGTGNDWIKTYNIPNNIEKAIEIILRENTILQDIGVAMSKANTIYFNNVAGLGYDGYVVHKLNKLKPFGSFSYLIAGAYGLLFYKKSNFKILFNNTSVSNNCLMAVFGIGKYSGNGMQFTTDVNPVDGYLNLTIAKDFSFSDLLFNIHKLYNGKIVKHKKVETFKTKEIKVVPEKNPYIQADGELVGTGELSVKLIPKAIKFVVNELKS